VTFLVEPFEVVLHELKGIKNGLVCVVFVNIAYELFFVLFGDAGVEDGEDSSFFGVLRAIDFKVEGVLLELEVQLHFLFEEERPHFEGEVEVLVFEWSEVVCVFADDLVVLLLDGIFQAVDDVDELLLFEEQQFVQFDLFLHLLGLIVVGELFEIDLGELDHLFGFGFRLFFLAGV
jgi:hypothetical protein